MNLPTHAILGATGKTGSAVLLSLLETPTPLKIKILIRSEAKLLKVLPLNNPNPNLGRHILSMQFGSIDDEYALEQCLDEAEVVYNCVGSNEVKVGNDLDERNARKIVKALRNVTPEGARPPLVLVNRTVGLNDQIPNPGPGPGMVQSFMKWALDWVLDDMRAAGRVYEAASEEGLLSHVFVDGPKLFEGEATGFELVRAGRTSTMLNYGDLGAAFVEIAKRGDEFKDQAVGVSATGKVDVNMLALIGSFLDLIMRGVRGKLLGW